MEAFHMEEVEMLRKRHYSDAKKIGSGSFGSAFLVKDPNGQTLVCKTVDISQGSRKEAQGAIKEAQLMASFRHPFIVQCHGSFIASGWLSIVMAYCERGDLGAEIVSAREKNQPFEEERILLWTTQALLAIKYIHGRHVLHRDLKSSNFFLSSNYNLKMGDFGIAKVLASTAACARTQTGTLNYLSPEVCQERPYTWPSDIWALGVILYEMCTLRVPFVATNVVTLVHKICRGPIPLPDRSDVLRLLCSEMLNRSSAGRPSARALLQWQTMKDTMRLMLTQLQYTEVPPPPVDAAPRHTRGANGGRDVAEAWIPRDKQIQQLRRVSGTPPDSPRSVSSPNRADLEWPRGEPIDEDKPCIVGDPTKFAARADSSEGDTAPWDWDDEVFKLCDELGIDQRGEYTPVDSDLETPPQTPPSEPDDPLTLTALSADERALLEEIAS